MAWERHITTLSFIHDSGTTDHIVDSFSIGERLAKGDQGCPQEGGKKTLVKPTETNVHGDALCFMVMGPSLLQRLAVGGWRLVGIGGWLLMAVGRWQLVAVGGWRLVVPGGSS